jgi:hypothetical protein
LQNNPQLAEAKGLNQKIALSDRLKNLNRRVEAVPDDTLATQQLIQAVTEVTQSPVANPATIESAKRAQQTLRAPSNFCRPTRNSSGAALEE